jgi:hypothetical protein
MLNENDTESVSRDLTASMVDSIMAGNAVEAQAKFEDIIAIKATHAMDARKAELSQTIFNSKEETSDE